MVEVQCSLMLGFSSQVDSNLEDCPQLGAKVWFFTQSELIEPDSPQAAQLGIYFFFHNKQVEMHLLEGPDKGHSAGEGKESRKREEKKLKKPGRIQAHVLQITRRVL